MITSYTIYKGATPEDAVRFVERLIEESGEEPMAEELRELPFEAYREPREEWGWSGGPSSASGARSVRDPSSGP